MSSSVTPELIKQLRERTGVGMAKCSAALKEANGDIELAIANLRKAGIASAVKKEGRDANDGAIGFVDSAAGVGIVEVNSETDFVAKNAKFQDFLHDIAEEVVAKKLDSVEALLATKYSKDPSHTMDELRSTLVQSLGENIQVRRLKFVEKKPKHSIGVYSHMQGKILCMVEISGCEDVSDFAREIAMHIAAEAPDYLAIEEIPQNVLDHERDIAKSQIKNKPENIIDKIVEGKMRAFYDQVCLLHQHFVKDTSLTIAQLVEQKVKAIGKPLKIVQFLRWQLSA